MGRSKSTPGLVESKGKVPMSNAHRKEFTSASTATLLTDDEGSQQITSAAPNSPKNDDTPVTDSQTETPQAVNKNLEQQFQNDVYKKLFSQQSFSPIITNPASQPIVYHSPHLLTPNVTMLNFDPRGGGQTAIQANLYASPQLPFYTSNNSQAYSPFCGLSPAASTNHLSMPSNSVRLGATPSPTRTPVALDDPGAAVQPNNNIAECQSQEAMLSEIKRLRGRLLTLETENASMSMKLNQQQWQVENR